MAVVFGRAGQGRIIWDVPVFNIVENIHHMRRRTLDECERRFGDFAKEVEAWMKANHVWENQSGAAEASLTAQVVRAGGVGGAGAQEDLVMEIGYDLGTLIAQQVPQRGRDYSIYLETMQGGRFSILEPTMIQKAPEVIERFDGALTL